jgi:predicted nucleic acid-binding protein
MSDVYVFDACSLISVLSNEKGADVVKNLLHRAVNGEIKILMHKINFLEVYYYIYKRYDEGAAQNVLKDMRVSPIKLHDEITDDMLIKAGRLKSRYKMSVADSIGLAEAIINNGYFVTADHHELDVIEKKERLNMIWIR